LSGILTLRIIIRDVPKFNFQNPTGARYGIFTRVGRIMILKKLKKGIFLFE